MSQVPFARLALAALVLHSLPASADQIDLDLPNAIARAHQAAPAAVGARGQIAIANAAVTGANLPFIDNPEIEAGAGPRLISTRPTDVDARIEQNLELGRRSPRRQLARAGVTQTQAELDAMLRELDLEVTKAFYDALFAVRAAELAKRAEDFAQRAAAVADRRRKAGEITDLDANLARTALGRARSATQSAQSDQASAVGRLAALIGATPDDAIVVRGDLKPAALPDLATLRGTAGSRADIRVLDAERGVARAERAQASANGLPQVWLWAGYQREDTQSIVLGGLRMTFPLWNRAQGEKAAATARERRASDMRATTLRAAGRESVDAFAAYTSARLAVEGFETDVVPLLDDSEQLLQKTIDAGQIAVSDYLVARQQILDGRREHLERLLALAKAAATARFVAGGAP
ncbi:MAG TPA: TolC family protein [Kofleriaceae bacterium]|nr:TolC family protein [Kofleriaceae bacterium]